MMSVSEDLHVDSHGDSCLTFGVLPYLCTFAALTAEVWSKFCSVPRDELWGPHCLNHLVLAVIMQAASDGS